MKITPYVLKLTVLLGAIATAWAFALHAQAGTHNGLVPVLAILITLVLLRYDQMVFQRRIAAQAQLHLDEAMVKLRRDLAVQEKVQYWQLEALVNIVATVQPRIPLPPTRKWAASPDLLRLLMHEVLSRRPSLVMEASSGTSTVIIAYCLQKLGGGRVVALEHDVHYAQRTREMIALHGLTDFAEVVDAPLVEHRLKDGTWKWYDIAGLQALEGIDMLVVDGPPEATQAMARYPALPLLHQRFSERSVVIMDDGQRPDEREIASRWASEFEARSSTYLELEKGAWVLEYGTL